MSELITSQIFTDGQKNINAANMNGIIGGAVVQPDVIANKVQSATLDVADQMLVLKTNNTLAKARFDTIVNSTSSNLPLCDTTKNGMLRQVSGKATDFVDGTNNCQPISSILPPGVVVSYAGPNIPSGWLFCDGSAISRTTYADLFAAIGGYYGAGDGSTTFNIPNCVGRVAAYYGSLAATGGASTMTLSTGHLPSHAHTLGNHTHVGADHQHYMQNHTHYMDHAHNVPAGSFSHTHSDSGHAHNYNTLGSGNTWAGAAGGWGLVNGVTSVQSANLSTYNSPLIGVTTAGNTNAGWANTTGPSTPLTALTDRGLTTTGPSTNTSDYTGSGAAFYILPPYINMYYIIKT